MKERKVTIDINKLNDVQLEQLAAMFYSLKDMDSTKAINARIAFLRGWTEKENL